MGAKGQWHHEVGDRRRRAGGAAGRCMVRVVRVPGGDRALDGGELVGDGLAQNDPAGGADQGDAGGVAVGPVSPVNWRAVLGRHVVGIDDILHRDRDTVERAPRRLPRRGHEPQRAPVRARRGSRPGCGHPFRRFAPSSPRSAPPPCRSRWRWRPQARSPCFERRRSRNPPGRQWRPSEELGGIGESITIRRWGSREAHAPYQSVPLVLVR